MSRTLAACLAVALLAACEPARPSDDDRMITPDVTEAAPSEVVLEP